MHSAGEHFCFIAHAARIKRPFTIYLGRPSPAAKRLAEGNCKLNLFPAASSCHANAQEGFNANFESPLTARFVQLRDLQNLFIQPPWIQKFRTSHYFILLCKRKFIAIAVAVSCRL